MLISKILTPLRCGNRLLDLSKPVVAGIINVTPDSFFPASRMGSSLDETIDFAGKMIGEGASILDIGGMSTRPGSEEIPVSEELDRVIPVIQKISETFPEIILSADTYRSEVAKEAINAGATIINDISGGNLDPLMFGLMGKQPAAYVLMHMRGKPANMQLHTDYQDIIADLLKYFVNKLGELHHSGVRDIMIDPGFGFSKTIEQNYRIIQELGSFRFLGCPIMIGVSRKSTLSKTIARPVEETLSATTALHMVALQNGASVLRVHDVRAAMDAIAVYNKLTEVKNH